MNLQNLVRCVGSTCHDGLLAPGMWDCAWRTPRGVGPPETHPHSQAVVVYAEYSSSTLTPGLQLCKECKYSTLWRSLFCFLEDTLNHDASLEPFLENGSKFWVIDLV